MRQIRIAAMAVAAVLTLATWAFAQDYDRDDYRGGVAQAQQYGYQSGYNDGIRKGQHEGRENDPYDFRPGDREDFHGGYNYDNLAYNTGYQDGASVARDDVWHNKPLNPNPRGKYDDMDHGYRRDFGDKNYYKQQYAAGYRAGYESAFSRRY